MWLIVGLGNPGTKYASHRHNIGFRVVQELARRHGISGFKDKFSGQIASGFIANTKVQLLKPMEYMNNSGFAVQRTSQFFDIEPKKTLVVHDEIDLPVGRLRLKTGGGHGGHNGLRSIIAQLGNRDFLRVRVGVGKPPGTAASASSDDSRVSRYVLSNFPADQSELAEELVTRSTDAVEAILDRGIRAAMNDYNRKPETPESDNAESEPDKNKDG